MLLAALELRPGGIIAWIVIGLIAGWLAGLAMRGGGFGIAGDIITGLIGALIGGFLMSFFVEGDAGFWGSIAVSFIGACVLIAIVRALAPRSRV
ncbi:MAG: GlsB/YeaQ/YmgE family stress response membrane protein [Gemmataceae bacterium]